ncbi:MAG TPA: S-layer homology domain-containing protein [Paenibacillaceae bacterium]
MRHIRICLLSLLVACLALGGLHPANGWLSNRAHAEGAVFPDTETHWAKTTIRWALEKGFVTGYSDGLFRPDQPVTEAEFLAMLIRAFEPETARGSDGNPAGGNWADAYYELSRKLNYPVHGDDPDSRSKFISRRQVAELIAASQGFHYEGNDAVRYILARKLANGKDRNVLSIENFDPDAYLTRAEALQFIKNLADTGAGKLKARPEEPSPAGLLPDIPLEGGSPYITVAEFVRDAVVALYGHPPLEDLRDVSHWADPYYDYAESKGAGDVDYPYSYSVSNRDRQLVRGGAARILARMMGEFIDVYQTDKAVQFLYKTGISCGVYTDRGDYFANFDPTGRLTRSQAADMIDRARRVAQGETLPVCKGNFQEKLTSRIKDVVRKLNRNYEVEFFNGYTAGIGRNGRYTVFYNYEEYPNIYNLDRWKIEVITRPEETFGDIPLVQRLLKDVGGVDLPDDELRAILNDVFVRKKDVDVFKENLTFTAGRIEMLGQTNFWIEWSHVPGDHVER